MSRFLSKSLFKLGLECPTKLFYANKSEYADKKNESSFLEAIIQGGFQVEELAKFEFQNGIQITGEPLDYNELVIKTNKQLIKENVVLFEPAFSSIDCFIRIDILVKNNNQVQLIEVKSKSYDSNDQYALIGKRGELKNEWAPYLFDIAFQYYILSLCHPEWEIEPFLLVMDKNKASTVDGLNQMFKISPNGGIIIKEGLKKVDIGKSIFNKVAVKSIIKGIISGQLKHNSSVFQDSLKKFTKAYKKNTKLVSPLNVKCKTCEFHTTDKLKKSGFIECWTQKLSISENNIASEPKVYDINGFRGASRLMSEGKYFMRDVTLADIKINSKKVGLSLSERQWLQVQKVKKKDKSFFLDKKNLKAEISKWKFPLHFIDFETSMTAIPFNKGRKPYELIAFQFSHHLVQKNGTIIHKSEYLNSKPGEFPNFSFIRALKKSLDKDNGSIFRYSHHENTVLNTIYQQLKKSDEDDKSELLGFIETISHSNKGQATNNSGWIGSRDMIDLCELIKLYYYDPSTHGSNSIKDILPSILSRSEFLTNKYKQPLNRIDLTSNNFKSNDCILHLSQNGQIINPYKMLPNIFENWNETDLDKLISDIEGISDGGSAMIAYAKLQFEEMTIMERAEIKNALLKYCELDTLAMVMIYEFFSEKISVN
ncbi:DUF2779 domain-containing protein [Flagellimonas zhangzhouensis]|uniref:DUF2779 domain-containing protein n=1 Tax=Flagellimonas zhangzhouensis TaxID=1073328 RepID=A0A1H2XSJ9_9FLAO|nr:DUF2779 domain-containing protein [Allomuricauda zhangzhouensis]SDQ91128.1 protein of unknown function [Allomuricauda zhangzhouensis]SDW95912.1 protein of unknown function [Allomuricauda zhangzhouensis]